MEMLDILRDGAEVVDFARGYFKDDTQALFAVDFVGLIKTADPHPIPADKITEWLEYGADDLCELLPKALDPHEYTMSNVIARVSISGYKKLELLARATGHVVRSFCQALEGMAMAYVMHRSNAQITSLQNAVKAAEQARDLIFGRKFATEPKGDVVYLIKHGEGKYKVGSSDNIAAREQDYLLTSPHFEMVYTKRCFNRVVLEKLVHHMLFHSRPDKLREWALVSEETGRAALDAAAMFMDGLLGRHVDFTELRDKMQQLVESFPLREEATSFVKPGQPSDAEPDNIVEPTVTSIDLSGIKNPADFDRFVSECCELGGDSSALMVELTGAHRLWGRSLNHCDALVDYLDSRFKRKKISVPHLSAKLAGYRGISLKPCQRPAYDEPRSRVDAFIDERCNVSYTARVETRQLFRAFEAWRREQDPEYVLTPADRRSIDIKLSTKFVVGRLPSLGWHGLELKDQPTTRGLQLRNKLKKPVAKIDVSTGKVVATFAGLQEAAVGVPGGETKLSADIRFQNPVDGYLYRYIDRGQDVRPDPTASSSSERGVQVLDASGQVVRSYSSAQLAAHDLRLEFSTMCLACREKRSVRAYPGYVFQFTEVRADALVTPVNKHSPVDTQPSLGKQLKQFKLGRPIEVLDASGNVIRTYVSLLEAATDLKVEHSTLCLALRKQRGVRAYPGLTFRYKMSTLS